MGNTFYLPERWSVEQKDEALPKWKSVNEMLMATIKFAIAIDKLEDKTPWYINSVSHRI